MTIVIRSHSLVYLTNFSIKMSNISSDKKTEKMLKFEKKMEKNRQLKSETPKEKKSMNKTTDHTFLQFSSNGEKKNLSIFPDSYQPKFVESGWYSWWEKQGFFKPEYRINDKANKFVICMPPPNVTGTLHLGHALTCSLEDSLIRWHRMNGKMVLWNPGCDHAGIATQVVVEKKLKRELGLTRHDLGREKFLNHVWQWKSEKGAIIYDQMKRLGISCDWSREKFTMDETLSQAVVEAFVRLHEQGLIYRSYRLVNWSCTLQSAISDIEIDKIDLSGRTLLSVPGYDKKIEFGVIIYFKYPLEFECKAIKEIVVATTRLETMLGDVAIAVHPADTRYKNLIGKYVLHPFCNRKIPIICDETVDIEFGTGAVKITPSHDQNDFEIARRARLSPITIFSEDGLIFNPGDFKKEYIDKFKNLKRFDCRYVLLDLIKSLNLFVEIKENPMSIPVCSRSKDIVEPFLKSQWYVKCESMASAANDCVRNSSLKIMPKIFEKTWFTWMNNCKDWCISRQLWWGHRIPAYRICVNGEPLPDVDENWISARTVEEAIKKAKLKFTDNKNIVSVDRDNDVLDTWFSSGIFPFSIFGWPNQTKDLEMFYPTTLLETGHDILFFWVARMVMLGLQLTGKLPFSDVFLHAIVRDANGRKMSKSLGNIVDPINVIDGISLEKLINHLHGFNLDPHELLKAEKTKKADFPNGIPECGADALRFTLCAYTSQSRDINLDVLRIQGYRHFCNKIWNAFKFSLTNLGSDFVYSEKIDYEKSSYMDKWILSRLDVAIDSINNFLSIYDFQSATSAIHHFWIYDLCDVYLEYLKPIFVSTKTSNDASSLIFKDVLYKCIDSGIRLLAPFMPFLTEELFQRLPKSLESSIKEPTICLAAFPKSNNYFDKNLDMEFEKTINPIIKVIRSLKEKYLSTKTKSDVYIQTDDRCLNGLLCKYCYLITTLTIVNKLTILTLSEQIPDGCVQHIFSDKCQIYLLIKGSIDVSKEVIKLEEKKEKLVEQINKLLNQMNLTEEYQKIPNNIKEKNKEKLSLLYLDLDQVNTSIGLMKKF